MPKDRERNNQLKGAWTNSSKPTKPLPVVDSCEMSRRSDYCSGLVPRLSRSLDSLLLHFVHLAEHEIVGVASLSSSPGVSHRLFYFRFEREHQSNKHLCRSEDGGDES